MEHLASYVSSRGLLRSCRSHNRQPKSSCSDIDTDLLRDHRDGATIYVCADAIPRFAREFLPQLDTSFVLVSGDSDVLGASQPESAEILEHPHLVMWYAQNPVQQHPKLRVLPIGLDYHTVAEKPGLWELLPLTALEQEHKLRSVHTGRRLLAAYANFIGDRGDRRECLEQVDPAAVCREPTRLPRFATWQRQAQFAFTLSPSGLSPDCHRTWEAIALGSVPIVKRTWQTAALFHDLPVIQVDSWAQVTRAFLVRWLEEPKPTYNFASMFLAQWVRRFAGLPFENLTSLTGIAS